MKIKYLIAAMILSIPTGAMAANCEKNPSHPQCPGGGGGEGSELTAYDFNGQEIGKVISLDGGSGTSGWARYNYVYQGESKVVPLNVHRESILSSQGDTVYYADPGCTGYAYAWDYPPPIFKTVFQPPTLVIRGIDAAWLYAVTGVDYDVEFLAFRRAYDSSGRPAGTCAQMASPTNKASAARLEFIVDLSAQFTPPFEFK